MPTTYAHWAFGRDCIELMPKNLQKIIHEHRDIYNLGVHGPDILFYDLLHPKVTKTGSDMHNVPVKEFFKTCKDEFKVHDEKAEMLSYIMGFFTHFILDSTVHGYVERKRELSTVSHNKIESEWDKHVIKLDNRKPNLVDRAESLRPNKKNAKVISYFYPFSARVILRTCRWQKNTLILLNSISHKKQDFFTALFSKNKFQEYLDLFMSYEDEDECRDSNLRLDKLRKVATRRFKKYMPNLINYLNEKEELEKYFNHDLSVWPNYKKIEVLPYRKEVDYKVR